MLETSWWWFFVGSLLDALIGPNLFFPGEPFLLAAGYILSSGLFYGVLSVLAGGFIGDQLSYHIGRKFGDRGRRWLSQRIPKTRRPIARARLVLRKKGPQIVTAARLLGPVAWIMPFLAGSYAMPWLTFTLYSVIGLLLGVSQFVLAGYLLAQGVELLPDLTTISLFIKEHSLLLAAITIASTASLLLYRYQGWKKWLRIGSCWIIVMAGANYFHFFISDSYAFETGAEAERLESRAVSVEELDYTVFPGLAPVYQPQPINAIVIGSTPQTLMDELGWIENKTFSRNEMTFKGYLGLLAKDLPPISDLYWNQQPQWLAYQIAGDLVNRRHIRWWYAGIDTQTQQNIWVGSISYDNDLKVAHYKGIITILHAIDPDIDIERDTLAENAAKAGWHVSYQRLGSPVAYSKSRHYFSDGQVAILSRAQS
ncbi:LssY C-terminal domain-containing protein [Photobacterium sp. SDRW27]|uniref:LssY C-terminal domain-containing protein n=1 Tax=Photobacterium obscurum TaxID=2829490 RepID=UPI002244B9EB|nr:LssY C-terminal domain-containing protein [Photobacterium obscurum]MCW8329998.1 LssY C-terminal domain-containing protein [Photobacterium obscurum]